VQLQYEALETIDVEDGTATLFISPVLAWKDPRLAWEIDGNNTCASKVNAFASHEIETTTIWGE
jgi:hypothetical protein